jgi:hypothetical protein
MIFALFAVSLAAFGGYAQEMPEEIKAFLDNYIKDSTEKRWGPLVYKKEGIIPKSIPITDLKFRTLQVYNFKGDISLNEYPDDVALSEVIVPNGFWRVLVMAHDKPFYELMIDNRTGKPIIVEVAVFAPIIVGSDFKSNRWGPLLKAYPESARINPMLLGTTSWRNGFLESHHFLYFKQLGSRKVYYCNQRGHNRLLDSLFTASIEKLDDSKKLINWKKRDIIESKVILDEERKKLEKTKGANNDESIEQKGFSAPPIYMRGRLRDVDTTDLFPVGGGNQ